MSSAGRGKKFPPVYQASFEYAREHDESKLYFESRKLNMDCKTAIEKAINEHYDYNRFSFDSREAVLDVAWDFGYDRMLHVLAGTIQSMNGDGRISRANKEWAQTVIIPGGIQTNREMVITQSHPVLLDTFVKAARHEHLLRQPLKAADIKAEAAQILKRLQAPSEPNSPNGTHYMAQVSPDFLARAKTKDHDRLMAMLPFSTLTLSTLDGHKGVFALVHRDEARNRPLRLRSPRAQKPSIKEQLAENSVPGGQPSKARDKGAR